MPSIWGLLDPAAVLNQAEKHRCCKPGEGGAPGGGLGWGLPDPPSQPDLAARGAAAPSNGEEKL